MLNRNECFEKLYSDYHPMVHQMCMGFMKGSGDLAKDLTQETFINIWGALDKFKGDSSYKTWIYRITVNTCLKSIRDNKTQNHVSLDQHIIPTQHQNQQNAGGKPYQELYRAIGQLSDVNRLIVIMMLDEVAYKDIAEVVGITEGNLRVKIHRIKKKLKEVLTHE